MPHQDGAHKIHIEIVHSKDVFESGLNEARLPCYQHHTLPFKESEHTAAKHTDFHFCPHRKNTALLFCLKISLYHLHLITSHGSETVFALLVLV